MTFHLRGKVTGDQQLVEWTNILSKIKLRSDNQQKTNRNTTEISEYKTTKDMSKEIRQGRRAGNTAANLDDDDILDSLGSTSDTGPVPPDDMPPRPSRRQGGWANETSKDKKKNTGQDVEAFEEDERFRMDNTVSKDDDNDILVIPDLEEVQEEDMATQIAAPPSVQVNRVATYKELDNYLQKHAALFTLDGEIDLKLLSNVLSPEIEVFEEDKAWDWNRLFTEVASELQSEWDKQEEMKGESTEKT